MPPPSPSPSASRAPATAASGVLTAQPSLAAAVVLTTAPIDNPTISPTDTPTIQSTTVEPPSMAPSAGAPGAIESYGITVGGGESGTHNDIVRGVYYETKPRC
mmetsp:Transcript_24493/g.54830  ORF Transcript_24493/g.54830 Transcript_24493/m.54830 type:complete len:103 (-) Transcript_24493:291-599(-)